MTLRGSSFKAGLPLKYPNVHLRGAANIYGQGGVIVLSVRINACEGKSPLRLFFRPERRSSTSAKVYQNIEPVRITKGDTSDQHTSARETLPPPPPNKKNLFGSDQWPSPEQLGNFPAAAQVI